MEVVNLVGRLLCCCFGAESVHRSKEYEEEEENAQRVAQVTPRSGHFPYASLDRCLRDLAGNAEGFGSGSIGGFYGRVYHVTTLHEDGPGSLREACKRNGPLWIVFDVCGRIHLTSGIKVKSYKTIDGRGQWVMITGDGLQLDNCEHVIVCNIEFECGRGHDVDAIKLKPNARNIWIDRCTFSDYDDGLIDITRASTNITISRCHFFNNDKTMLIGADPKHVADRCIRVTIHHCFFDGTRQQHPRLRFGKVHLYNNYTRLWGLYGVCASVEAQILSQCNIYEAGKNTKAFEYYSEKAGDRDCEDAGSTCSEGDLFLNGAKGVVQNANEVFKAEDYYSCWTMVPATEALSKDIVCWAGWQNVSLPPDV